MGKIYICITVDWEGENLKFVDDLLKIRKEIDSDIPFTHFICPNYFTQNIKGAAQSIKKAIKPIDEIGLHIHCYRDLINYIPDVSFKTDHNYYNVPGWFENRIINKIFPKYQRSVSGRGVPLSVYNKSEIEKIINKSKSLLCDNLNIDAIKGFRAGGWIANDTILEITEKSGFKYDSSAIAPSILSNGYSENNMGTFEDDYGDKNGVFSEYIVKLWGYMEQTEGFLKNTKILEAQKGMAVQTTLQPYLINNLLEIPNNCGLSDFCSVEKTVFPLINEYLFKIQQDSDLSYVIVYGCHQEGAMEYKKQMLRLFSKLEAMDTSMVEFKRMDEIFEFKRLGLL